MKKPVFSTVVFDFDGTIADTREDIFSCIRKSYKAEKIKGVNPKPEQMGPPLMEFLKLLTPKLNQNVLEKVAANFKEEYDTSDYPNTELYPEIEETLKELKKKKIRLYLVTLKRKVPTLRFIKSRKLKYFKQIVNPDSNPGVQMNKAEMMAYLLEKEKLKAESALYVGDAATDITSAHANKLKVAGVTYGYNTREQLKKAGPDYLIDNIKELIDIIFE